MLALFRGQISDLPEAQFPLRSPLLACQNKASKAEMHAPSLFIIQSSACFRPSGRQLKLTQGTTDERDDDWIDLHGKALIFLRLIHNS